ncbi:O-antigen ligase [Aureimonas sp. AU20]|uniref:O-antigen ligase family protein n=1 Tax=Aureimonas sp. AU20 TaxID=1349819 RepID=UPI0007228D88|nr:O-antigen ligase family protein [Aureimonas sp. AU20]ALN72051.1 hypothetical protein M673_04940 [Aureimonas sp. AU20]
MAGLIGARLDPRRLGRLAFCLVLAAGFVWKAAATPIPALLSALAFALLASAATFCRPAGGAGRLFDRALLIGGALALFALFQAFRVEGNPLAHPVWSEASPFLGALPGAISVAPYATLQAMPTALAPFLAFAATLAFFHDDRSATRLLRLLALLGGAFAAFGLVQVTLAPGSLLLFEKQHYLDSLTGFWVNRNAAGALLGVASLAALAWLVDAVKGLDLSPRTRLLPEDGAFSISPDRLLPAGILVLCVLALFLSKSRGALMATVGAYAVVLPLILHDLGSRRGTGHRDGPADRPSRVRRFLLAAASGLLLVGLVVGLFGGLSSARLAQEGVDDGRLCFYRAALEAIRDRPAFGFGLGTFDWVFPAYRQADCAALPVSVSRAHNVYLEALVDLGLPFLLLAFCLVGALLHMLLAGYRARIRRRHVPIVGLGVVILLALHGLVDFSLQVPGMALYAAAFLGAVGTIGSRRAAGRGARREAARASAAQPAV